MNKHFLKIFFLFISLATNAFAIEEFSVNSDSSFNPTYKNKFSFLLGINPSVQKASDIENFTFAYGKKVEDYWIDTNILLTKGLFSKLTTNNESATGVPSSDVNNTKSTLITIGAGIGRESRYVQSLLPFKDLYEVMAADLTYNILKEKTSEKTFKGFGMLAKFSLYKKFSDYVSLGTQFTYNLSAVKRSSDNENEISSARSLTLSYLTIGFDLSFFL